MIFWLDAQLPPALAPWLTETFGIPAQAVRDLDLREAKDPEIFQAARDAAAVVMTKDADFPELVERLGPPPQVIWITCGNTTNARLREILTESLPTAIRLLEAGEPLIEITGRPNELSSRSTPDYAELSQNHTPETKAH